MVCIEDNTTFPGKENKHIEGYETLQQLSSGFKKQILNRSLEDLSKSSKMIVYPSYLDYLGGKNPEKDDRFILKADESESQYTSGNLVGFIGYGNEQLIIKSRFGKCLFLYLLEKVFRIHIARDFGSGTDSGLTILDVLCFSFPICLKSALIEGIYKEYVSHSYNDFISKQSPHTIADAKYKPVEKINSEDRRRMIEYLWRFDSMPGYFIYPETAGEERYKKWFKPEGFNSKAFGGNESESSAQLDSLVAIVACGVKIPQEAENYGVFPAVMEKEEEKFKKEFLNRIANHGKG